MTRIVKVTKRDIELGAQGVELNPIAIAASRVFGFKLEIGLLGVWATEAQPQLGWLPDEADERLREFLYTDRMKPFKFELSLNTKGLFKNGTTQTQSTH